MTVYVCYNLCDNRNKIMLQMFCSFKCNCKCLNTECFIYITLHLQNSCGSGYGCRCRYNHVLLKLENKSNTCDKTHERGNGQSISKQHTRGKARIKPGNRNRAENPKWHHENIQRLGSNGYITTERIICNECMAWASLYTVNVWLSPGVCNQ